MHGLGQYEAGVINNGQLRQSLGNEAVSLHFIMEQQEALESFSRRTVTQICVWKDHSSAVLKT